MAGRIAGITIEIGGDTKKLQTALKGVDNQLKATQNGLKDINKLLKLDPKNTELLAQKQKTLQQAIQQTKTRLQQLKEAQSQVKEGTAEWDALQREIIETEQQLKSLEKQYRQFGSVAAQQIASVGRDMQKYGDKMANTGKTLTTKVTLPLVAVGTLGVKSFAEVDKTMQLANKTMGNTEEEAKLVNDAMKEAAANSTFGMTDAATAVLNFARAGLDAEQSAAALAPAMNLAAGEGGNLDTVSSGLVATINGFQDDFSKATEYADVFAAACNNSALDIDSLSSSMATAAPVFNAAGYTVNDAALYMGVMANNGIEASEAANSLKTGFARLIDPAKEGAVWLDKFSFSITDADGNMKDTITIQKELHDSFAGLSEAEQIEAASAIFGKNQMSKWLALINTAPEDVEELSQAINKSDGVTQEMADTMMNGFGGSIEKLKSSLDVLMTTLGELLSVHLQPIIDKIQEWADKFNSLDEGTQNTIVTIGMIIAAIGPLLFIGGKIISGVGKLLQLAPMLASGISFLLSPVGLVIAGIVALIAVGVLLYKNWDTIKTFAINTWNNIVSAVTGFIESIKTALSTFADSARESMAQTWENVKTAASEAWNNVITALSDAAEKFVDVGKKAIDKIREGISNAWEGLKSWFSGIWDSLFGHLTAHVEVEASSSGGVGEYATGLNYVPYDGFPAILHRGEAVLTAQEATDWRSGTGSGASIDYDRLAAAISARPIVIEGDTNKIFRVVRTTNTVRTRATNYNALGASYV